MFNSKPYQTALRTIDVPGQESLEIYTLLDRQQYYDPTGAAGRLGICSAAWPLFGMLWPSGLQLAIKIAKKPVDPLQKILEIGCGLGIASLAAHRAGGNVTASDRHPMARHFLNKNLLKNKLPKMRFKYGQWGQTESVSLADTGSPILSQRYDLIMGSDLLYEPNSPRQVAAFIDRHAASKSEVWVIDPNRGYRNHFSRSMAEFGFSLDIDEKIQRSFSYSSSELTEAYTGRFLIYRRDF